MDHHEQRAIEYLIKPWEALNTRLGERVSIKPDVSRVILDAAQLVEMINHFREQCGERKLKEEELSNPMKRIRRLANSWKHRHPEHERYIRLGVRAIFEGKPDRTFRFIRNQIYFPNEGGGNLDLLEVTAAAILELLHERFNIAWRPQIKEGPLMFYRDALLYLDSDMVLTDKLMELIFFERDEAGNLVHYRPSEVLLNWTEDRNELPGTGMWEV